MTVRHPLRRAGALALAASLTLAGCSESKTASSDDLKKQLDQILGAVKDLNTPAKDIATASRTSNDQLKDVSARMDALQKSVSEGFARIKRGAIYLTLDEDAPCDNDPVCQNTARALCNRIDYPNGITSKVVAGLRPTLHALVCFD